MMEIQTKMLIKILDKVRAGTEMDSQEEYIWYKATLKEIFNIKTNTKWRTIN